MRKVFIAMVGMLVFASPSMAGDKGVMGALLGAGIGAGVGHAVDRSGGSGKGAAIGAIGGYIIGSQMDKSDRRAKEAEQRAKAAQQQQTRQPVTGGSTIVQDCAKGREYLDRSLKTNNNDDKVFYLEKAVKLCPGDARVHNDLGVAYYNRNERHDRDRARAEFREALRINPGYTVAKDNLSNL